MIIVAVAFGFFFGIIIGWLMKCMYDSEDENFEEG